MLLTNGTRSSAQVSAAPAALRGYGAVAFQTGKNLYIVDGDAPGVGAFRRIAAGGAIRAPIWSNDGKWLAYVRNDRLWLYARHAAEPHATAALLTHADRFVWSPTAAVGCIIRDTADAQTHDSGDVQEQTPNHHMPVPPPPALLTLVGTDGRMFDIWSTGEPGHVVDVRWSSTGRAVIAYRLLAPSVLMKSMHGIPFGRDTRWQVDGRQSIVEATLPPATRQRSMNEEVIAISASGGSIAFAADVPRHPDALLFWRGPARASSTADIMELVINTAVTLEAVGPASPSTGAISFEPDGNRFVFASDDTAQGARNMTASLRICTLTAICRTLAHPPATISRDPQWSPDGTSIAAVRSSGVAKRELWLQRPDGAHAQPLTAFGMGIRRPRWSRDGRRILVLRDEDVLLGSPDRSVPRRVVHGIAPADDDAVAWSGG